MHPKKLFLEPIFEAGRDLRKPKSPKREVENPGHALFRSFLSKRFFAWKKQRKKTNFWGLGNSGNVILEVRGEGRERGKPLSKGVS